MKNDPEFQPVNLQGQSILVAGRVGFSDENEHAVIFMMANSYQTGQVIDVDGGHMIRQYTQR